MHWMNPETCHILCTTKIRFGFVHQCWCSQRKQRAIHAYSHKIISNGRKNGKISREKKVARHPPHNSSSDSDIVKVEWENKMKWAQKERSMNLRRIHDCPRNGRIAKPIRNEIRSLKIVPAAEQWRPNNLSSRYSRFHFILPIFFSVLVPGCITLWMCTIHYKVVELFAKLIYLFSALVGFEWLLRVFQI